MQNLALWILHTPPHNSRVGLYSPSYRALDDTSNYDVLYYLGSFYVSDSISYASGRITAHKHTELSACCWMLTHQAR